MYYYNNNLGCLLGTVVLLVLFFSFTRVLFTTPIGWLIIAYVVIRWITHRPREMNRPDTTARNPVHEEPAASTQEKGFDKSDVIDIEFEEIDEDED